jgi:hypothetical protein
MRVDNWASGAKTARVGANSARGGRGGVVVPVVPTKDLVPLTFSLGGVAGTQTLYTAVQSARQCRRSSKLADGGSALRAAPCGWPISAAHDSTFLFTPGRLK